MDEKRHWIKVSERLPEPNISVLAWLGQGKAGRAYIKDGDWYFYYFDGCQKVDCEPFITHWQPLPSPPELLES